MATASDGDTKALMAAVGLGYIEQTFAYTDFTDDLGTSGRVDMTDPIPPGALVLGWRARVATGFTNDTTAVMQVGVDGDVDQFSADTTQSVLTSGTIRCVSTLAADSGDDANAAVTVRITVTGGADFTSINAGSMTVRVWYLI